MSWNGASKQPSRSFICGNCGNEVASEKGWFSNSRQFIYICHYCETPNYFTARGKQIPGPLLGKDVKNLPDDVESVYQEIRRSDQVGNYTSVILLGRKLIMHLAVDIASAEEGKKFVIYLDDLKKSGYVPPTASKILKKIKDSGNEKNHEIKLATKEESNYMIKFVESLLYFIYELNEPEEPESD